MSALWLFPVNVKCRWCLQDIFQQNLYHDFYIQLQLDWSWHGWHLEVYWWISAAQQVDWNRILSTHPDQPDRISVNTRETKHNCYQTAHIQVFVQKANTRSVFQVLSQVLVNGFYLNLCQSAEFLSQYHDSTAERRSLPQQYKIGFTLLLNTKYKILCITFVSACQIPDVSLSSLQVFAAPCRSHAPVDKWRAVSETRTIVLITADSQLCSGFIVHQCFVSMMCYIIQSSQHIYKKKIK